MFPRNDIHTHGLYSSGEFRVGINKMCKQRGLVLKNSLGDHWSTLSLVIRVFSTRSATIASPPPTSPPPSSNRYNARFRKDNFLTAQPARARKPSNEAETKARYVSGSQPQSPPGFVTATEAAKRGRTCKFPTILANFYDFSDVRILNCLYKQGGGG